MDFALGGYLFVLLLLLLLVVVVVVVVVLISFSCKCKLCVRITFSYPVINGILLCIDVNKYLYILLL